VPVEGGYAVVGDDRVALGRRVLLQDAMEL
jgi:hypothetical protein